MGCGRPIPIHGWRFKAFLQRRWRSMFVRIPARERLTKLSKHFICGWRGTYGLPIIRSA